MKQLKLRILGMDWMNVWVDLRLVAAINPVGGEGFPGVLLQGCWYSCDIAIDELLAAWRECRHE